MVYLFTPPPRLPDTADETKGQTAALFVSLYLVVLAFFILLNSISVIEMRKQTDAIGSVKDTFSIHPMDTRPRLRPVNQSGTELPLKGYLTEIEKLSKSSIELIESRLSQDGNVLELTMPTDAMFFPHGEALKGEAEEFLVKLAALIADPTRDKRLDLEAIFYVDLGFEEAFGSQLSVKRANTLLNMLGQLGADKRNLLFGIANARNTHRLTLTFELRDSDQATIEERITPAQPNLPAAPPDGELSQEEAPDA